jgi:hypothetical protein
MIISRLSILVKMLKIIYGHGSKGMQRYLIRLRKLRASCWDEDNCMTTLDVEHYAGYVAVFAFS